jgi:hypothetical protein
MCNVVSSRIYIRIYFTLYYIIHGFYLLTYSIACWITKATKTHSEYVLLLLFHCKNGYANAPQCYVTCTIAWPCYILQEIDNFSRFYRKILIIYYLLNYLLTHSMEQSPS